MRTVEDQGNSSIASRPQQAGVQNGQSESSDIVKALWRYRWAVLLPTIAGAIAGFLVYVRTPQTFRSTTRLMLESDNSVILDSMTGDFVGGVPSVDIVGSQLYSDRVVSMAFDDTRMQPFRERFEDRRSNFIVLAQEALVLEPEVADNATGQSLVMLLHFDHQDPELCEASIRSFSTALQTFFNERDRDSRGDLMRLISVAMEELSPKLSELEQRHRVFREEAPLAWDTNGNAINPHRERQLFLVQRRSELYEQLRQKQILLGQVETLAKRAKDPTVALSVIGQLLGVAINIKTPDAAPVDVESADEKIAITQLNKDLIPLIIERNKFAEQFGDKHPTVRQLDRELLTMKTELTRLVKELTSRRLEIIKESQPELVDPKAKAAEAVASIIYAAKAEVQLLSTQIAEVDNQIATEKAGAVRLAKFEAENRAMLREIDRSQAMMDELKEQMARVSLTDKEGGTRVIELTAPGKAYLVGPQIIKMVGIGSFLGLALGAGLALLLEKNSGTFRNPDEIADILGVPVLTHVPFFKGRVRKSKKGDINPYKDMDPYLAIVHQPASVVSEAIRSLRTNVFFEMTGDRGKIIQVTSPLPGDGKSTIAGNLACSIAQSGKRVLAIDCDLRRPQLTDNFAMGDQIGATNLLNGECEFEEACHQTPIATLQVMPSGPIPTNPAEALTLPDMGELLEQVRDEYDFVVLDTPPLLVVTDPSIVASMVDGVIMTLRIRRKSKPNANESISILRAVGANILGVVINNSDEAGSSDGYRGYGYYRYGRYTSRYYRRSPGNNGKPQRTSMVIQGRGGARSGESNGRASESKPYISAPRLDDNSSVDEPSVSEQS